MDLVKNLREQGVDEGLIQDALDFNRDEELTQAMSERIPAADMCFYGREIWEMCIAALLEEEYLAFRPEGDGQECAG